MTGLAAAPDRRRDDGPLAFLVRARAGRVPAAILVVGAVVPWVAVLVFAPDDHWRLPVGVGLGWLLLVGVASAARPAVGRLAWVAAPLLHLAEYVGFARLAVLGDAASLDTAYALAAVAVLHHYDLFYREAGRPQRVAGALAGGWPGRLVMAYAAAATGVARPAFAIAAGCAFGVFAGEALVTWKDQGHRDRMSVADVEEQM